MRTPATTAIWVVSLPRRFSGLGGGLGGFRAKAGGGGFRGFRGFRVESFRGLAV